MTEMPEILRYIVEEFNAHPYDINNGQCEEFAAAVKDRLPEAEAIWADDLREKSMFDGIDTWLDDHCFIRFQGRYYDAEEPEGVSSPDLLPFFWRQKRC